jgi:hypothetical protein
MNREGAKAWLDRAVASTSEPPLSSDDLELLLDTFAPGASDYNLKTLNRCAAEGWDWKASAAAEGHGKESDIYEHCVERRSHYSRRASGGGAVAKQADPDSVKALL